MQNAFWKLVVILFVFGGCLWAVNPPEDRIRLGRDLSGGVSLIYSVRMPEDVDRASLLDQTIRVLSERVNPKGVLDIGMTPLGTDRIEIVMPLPNEEVKALGDAFRQQLDAFVGATEIKRSSLERALKDGAAIDRFGGGSERGPLVAELQASYDTARALQESLAAAEAGGDVSAINSVKQSIADAEVQTENLQEELLSLSLDRGRVVRVLELPHSREVERDANDEIVIGEDGRAVLKPSPRELAIEQLALEFPTTKQGLEQVTEAWNEYQSRRTGLDDPKDLMRLLQGAGVLDFHIAVSPGGGDGVDIEGLRAQLVEVGPD
ncbi:MAG: hypothetical protein MK100_08565, partial [Phycisphaerales bacterium]|nr:hypothetical protein [Phycisphaerales bacterium]